MRPKCSVYQCILNNFIQCLQNQLFFTVIMPSWYRHSFYWSPRTCDASSLHGLEENGSCVAIVGEQLELQFWCKSAYFLSGFVCYSRFLSFIWDSVLRFDSNFWVFFPTQLCRENGIWDFAFLFLIFVSDAFRTLENNLQYILKCVLHFNHESSKAIYVSSISPHRLDQYPLASCVMNKLASYFSSFCLQSNH